MKTAMLMMCVLLGLVGCGKEQDNVAPGTPPQAKAVERADYRQLALLTMATISRSADLFAKLGDSDQTIYYREIYNPAVELATAWPVYYAPEGKNVPEALWDCREAVVSWMTYLDRATMKNPPDFVIRDAKKDLVRVQEKTELCDAAIK